MITPNAADFNEVCRVLTIPAGYAASVMGALFELTYPYRWEVGGDSIEDAIDAIAAMIDAAYESECPLPIEYPTDALQLWIQGKPISGTDPEWGNATGHMMFGRWMQGSVAQYDIMRFRFWLKAGVYSAWVAGIRQNNAGILSWFVDDEEQTDTIDLYASTTQLNQELGFLLTIPADGWHDIESRVNSKHASSSGYRVPINYLRVRWFSAT